MEFTEQAFQGLINKIRGRVESLDGVHVEVGIPSDKNARTEPEMNNATLGFIHEFGAPEANIPPRPFLIPGLYDATNDIKKSIKQDLGEIFEDVERGSAIDFDADTSISLTAEESEIVNWDKVGLLAVNNVRERFTTNNWPPLADSTIDNRKGDGPYQPLVDTGALRQSITYVIKPGAIDKIP